MLQYYPQQKDRVNRSFIAALNLLDSLQREPDRWEEECLSYALGALEIGLYSVADLLLESFARPVGQRPIEPVVALNAKPRGASKAMLRQNFGLLAVLAETSPEYHCRLLAYVLIRLWILQAFAGRPRSLRRDGAVAYFFLPGASLA